LEFEVKHGTRTTRKTFPAALPKSCRPSVTKRQSGLISYRCNHLQSADAINAAALFDANRASTLLGD